MTLQNTPSIILFPEHYSYTPSINYWTIDGDGDKCGFVVPVRESGILTQIAFGTGTVTTGDATFSVRIETVSTTTGAPTGTLYAANSNGTVNIADTDDNKVIVCDINGGTGVSVTKNDLIAVVFQRTALGSGNLRLIYNASMAGEQPYGFDDLSAGSYTFRDSCQPVLAYKVGGVWMCPANSLIAGYTANELIDNEGTPEQRGSILYLPFKCRAFGARVPFYVVAGSSAYVKLYSDPTGTPTEIASSALIDTDQIGNDVAIRYLNVQFVTPVALNINTKYALVVSPGDSGDISSYYFNCGINTVKTAYPGGQYGVYCSRNDTGAFSEDDTKWATFSLLIDQLDDGAGAGGAVDLPEPLRIGA